MLTDTAGLLSHLSVSLLGFFSVTVQFSPQCQCGGFPQRVNMGFPSVCQCWVFPRQCQCRGFPQCVSMGSPQSVSVWVSPQCVSVGGFPSVCQCGFSPQCVGVGISPSVC